MFSTTYYPPSPQTYPSTSRVFASSPLRPLSPHALNARYTSQYPSSSMSSPLSKYSAPPSTNTDTNTNANAKSPTPTPQRIRPEKHTALLRRQVTSAKDRHDARLSRSRTVSNDKKWDAKVEQVQYKDWLAEQRSWLRSREREAERVYGHEFDEEEERFSVEEAEEETHEEDRELLELLEFENASERVQIEEAERLARMNRYEHGHGYGDGREGDQAGECVDIEIDVDDWSEGDYTELLHGLDQEEHMVDNPDTSQDTEMS